MTTIPCIKCGKTLEPAIPGENQPFGAVICRINGNYGSTVWDPPGSHVWLEVNLCDECLSVAASFGLVLRVEETLTLAQKVEGWTPEE